MDFVINQKYEPSNIKSICTNLYDTSRRKIYYTIDELLDHNSKVLCISDIHQVCSIKLIRTDFVYPNSINTILTFDVRNDDLYKIMSYEYHRLKQNKIYIDKRKKSDLIKCTHKEYHSLLDDIDVIRTVGLTLSKIRNRGKKHKK